MVIQPVNKQRVNTFKWEKYTINQMFVCAHMFLKFYKSFHQLFNNIQLWKTSLPAISHFRQEQCRQIFLIFTFKKFMYKCEAWKRNFLPSSTSTITQLTSCHAQSCYYNFWVQFKRYSTLNITWHIQTLLCPLQCSWTWGWQLFFLWNMR